MRNRRVSASGESLSIDTVSLCAALVLVAVVGLAGTFRAGDVTVTTDTGTFAIPILFTHEDAAAAVTVVLDYDAALFTVDAVAVDQNTVVPEWHSVYIADSWASFGCVMDWAPPYAGQVLPAGADQRIGRFLCTLAEGLTPRVASIALPAGGRGDPPLFNSYVVDNLDVFPAVAPGTLTITWPAPTIGEIVPASTAGGEALTVQGANFIAGVTQFRLDGDVVGAIVMSATTAYVPVPFCTQGGERRISACNGGLCAEGYFTCRAAPVVSSIEPAISSGGTVTVHGSGFYAETTATLDGEAVAVTFHGETRLSLEIPACAARAVHAIEICNGLLCVRTACECWPGPAISSISPDSTAGNEELAIVGGGFVPGETVFLLDGAAVAYEVLSATEARVAIPACAAGGERTLTVCNATLCANAVFQCRGAPAIAAISPAVTTGGVLAIEGGSFYAETVFTVDGAVVAAVILDASHATIQAAPSTERVVRTVRACNGSLCGEGGFTCVPAVAITDVQVAFVEGRATLTVRGEGFLPDSKVTLDGALVAFTLTAERDLVIENAACAAARAVVGVCNDSYCDTREFPCGTPFRRADANVDGNVDIADAVRVLGYLFSHRTLECVDAADANDSGVVDIADAIFTLGYLFASTDAPPPPFENRGLDPTDDALSCDAYNP
jgi:hypothetical protein